MEIQQRILKFVTYGNWIILILVTIGGFILSPPEFARGILFGGLIVTINFHLLSRTLKRSLQPPHLASVGSVLAKYYIRFIFSAIIIFVLIWRQWVHPLGLFIGLSVVVVSIILATIFELKKLIFKEAV